MVLFTVGCNFKCEFCHNKYLLNPNVGRDYNIDELIDKISTNLLVSGVSITGGEPTLQKDLLELCKRVQRIGKYLSIDTNGSNLDVIKEVTPFVNRVAMDLKGPLSKDKYEKISGVKVDLTKILKTIKFLNSQEEIDFAGALSNRDFQRRHGGQLGRDQIRVSCFDLEGNPGLGRHLLAAEPGNAEAHAR